jgi:hypothetical protein
VPEIPPSDEVLAEEEARSQECVCPGCKVREFVDAALSWPSDDRVRFTDVLIAEAERLTQSIRDDNQ